MRTTCGALERQCAVARLLWLSTTVGVVEHHLYRLSPLIGGQTVWIASALTQFRNQLGVGVGELSNFLRAFSWKNSHDSDESRARSIASLARLDSTASHSRIVRAGAN